jgi:YbgC/YbaW family acyl-CoA thioester hydrolase
MFTYETTIRMRDVDAAGVLFFARYLALAHDAFEAFAEELGYGTARLMQEARFLLPVVKAESRYRTPLHVGEAICIGVRVVDLNRRFATLAYELRNQSGDCACEVRITYAALSLDTRKAIPLPEELRAALAVHTAKT